MNLIFIFSLSIFLCHGALISCPLCVGRIQKDNPPFFAPEFSYHSTQKVADAHSPKKFMTTYDEYMKKKGEKK
jgi:hypothetical protein